MARRLISLTGHEFDLEALADYYVDIEQAYVFKEDDKYFLESRQFDSLESESQVYEAGQRLITKINSTMALINSGYQPVTAAGLSSKNDDGSINHSVFVDAALHVRSRAVAKLSGTAAEGALAEEIVQNNPQIILSLAEHHPEVSEALMHFEEGTWSSLYKTYELIRDDFRCNITERCGVSDEDINVFTQTAQSKFAIGSAARHASKKFKPPDNPMSFEEAKVLVKTMLLAWIDSKKKG